jgi:hypothetical protein
MHRLPPLTVLLLLFAYTISAQVTGPAGCPAVEIKGPDTVTMAGGKINVSVALPPTLGFKWKISKGNIVNGQGTPAIEIQTSPIEGAYAETKVSLHVTGLPALCNSTAAATFPVTAIYDLFPIDEYENCDFNNERAHLDNLAVQTLGVDGSTAYIILEIKPGQNRTVLKRRVERIQHHLFVKRKWPNDRFVFLVRHSDHPKTQLWMFPWGTGSPNCPDCTTY